VNPLVQACVKYLLMSESKEEMQDRFRKEFENIWPGDFLNYFKEKILPKVIHTVNRKNSTQGNPYTVRK
jgi:hypothetical protein